MSTRGEIVVECDVEFCHAEKVLSPRPLMADGIVELMEDGGGWLYFGLEDKWVCPQCLQEGKRA
jgi:hypothetical protein